MSAHIDLACKKHCWNLIDSYGMICTGCGCCSTVKKDRYENRIRCLEGWLQEQYEFDDWMPEFRETQERNIKTNIRSFKRQLRYYRAKLEAIQSQKGGEADD